MTEKPHPPPEILLENGTNIKGDPFVTISWGKLSGAMSPDETRTLAHHMLAAAEAAETDAHLFRFFVHRMELDLPTFGQMLMNFREYRGMA